LGFPSSASNRRPTVNFARRDDAGNWRVIDQGFIRYHSGKVLRANAGDLTTIEIYLVNLDGTWGMKFFEYEGKFGGANDEGEGFIIQPWVLGIDQGRFSWSLVD
jgi:hypothetical protein